MHSVVIFLPIGEGPPNFAECESVSANRMTHSKIATMHEFASAIFPL